jgi:hypothetical protein
VIGGNISDQSAFEASVRLGGVSHWVAEEHFRRQEAYFDGPSQVRVWLAALANRLTDRLHA